MRKNTLLAVFSAMIGFLIATASLYAFEAPIKMQEDKANRAIPGMAPDYRKDVVLTGNSQTVEITDDLAWKAYTNNDAVFRTMSSSNRTGVKHTFPGGVWNGEVVHHRSPTSKTFLNFTGSAGTLRRH